jgi:hypothetical protein
MFVSVSPHRGKDHQLESRMREIRLSGSEGGGAVSRPPLPLSKAFSLDQARSLRGLCFALHQSFGLRADQVEPQPIEIVVE